MIAAVDNLIGSISTNELASGVAPVGAVVSALAGKGDDKSVSVWVEEVLDIVVARDVATGVGDGANVDSDCAGPGVSGDAGVGDGWRVRSPLNGVVVDN